MFFAYGLLFFGSQTSNGNNMSQCRRIICYFRSGSVRLWIVQQTISSRISTNNESLLLGKLSVDSSYHCAHYEIEEKKKQTALQRWKPEALNSQWSKICSTELQVQKGNYSNVFFFFDHTQYMDVYAPISYECFISRFV